MRESRYQTERQATRSWKGYIRIKAETLGLAKRGPLLGGRTTPMAERQELRSKSKFRPRGTSVIMEFINPRNVSEAARNFGYKGPKRPRA